jgi:hypothetical protein
MTQHEEFSAEVTRALAAALGTEDIEIRSLGTARVARLGEVRLVSANPTGRHNEQHIITVDGAGTTRSRAELVELAGRDVFVPVGPAGTGLVGGLGGRRARVTIDPVRNDWVFNKCDTATETITVTVPKSGAAPKADVYLLADTTASMGGVLASVAAAANAILTDPAFGLFDVAWAVGNYRDFPVDGGVHNSFAFQHQLSPTTVVADAVAAVGTWAAAEGSDQSEGQLFALDRIANDPAIGWRSDAKRIVVWMGDAPGHDPICAGLSGLGFDITEATTTTALTGGKITVVAVGTNTGAVDDLDGDPNAFAEDYTAAGCTPAGVSGQATRIAAATGGSYTSGLSPADVVAGLVELIKKAVTSIGNVHLTPTGGSAEFVDSITPAGGYGPLPGDTEHILTFTVTWRGTRPCGREAQEFTGAIDVVADGVVVATKPVRVTVPPCRFHYPVTFVCGPQKAGDRCVTVEPGDYATLVTIYNPSSCPVVIEKRFAPIAINGDVVAREPRTAVAKPFTKIVLGPGEVTMDDCCALREAVGPFDSLIGVLDLVANGALDVTVTTTVAGACGPHKSPDDGDDHGDDHGDDRGDDRGDDDKDDHDTRVSCCAPAISTRTIEPRMAP